MPFSQFFRSKSDSATNSKHASHPVKVTSPERTEGAGVSSQKSAESLPEKVLDDVIGDDEAMVDSPRVKRVQRHVSLGRSGRVKAKNKRKQLADNPALRSDIASSPSSPPQSSATSPYGVYPAHHPASPPSTSDTGANPEASGFMAFATGSTGSPHGSTAIRRVAAV